MKLMFCQRMEETELGWGERPDGYVLGDGLDELQRVVEQVLQSQKNRFEQLGIRNPQEYSRTYGTPYLVMTEREKPGWYNGKWPEEYRGTLEKMDGEI